MIHTRARFAVSFLFGDIILCKNHVTYSVHLSDVERLHNVCKKLKSNFIQRKCSEVTDN